MMFLHILLLSAILGTYYAEHPKSKLHSIFGRRGWYVYSLICAITGVLLLGAT